MALRIDQEKIVKYSDKAFLALAGAFLIVSAVLMLLSDKRPKVSYDTVVEAYNRVDRQMKDAHQRESILSKLKDDKAAADLFQQTPPYAGTFVKQHRAQLPPWIRKEQGQQDYQDRLAYYKAVVPTAAPSTYPPGIPPMEKRVAPEYLVVGQDKGYLPSGKEKSGILGRDVFVAIGRALVNLTQQTLWSREAARVTENEAWAARITSTLLVGYDVQRRERNGRQWTAWEDVRPVLYNDVARTQRLPRLPPAIRRFPDGDPKVLGRDEKEAAKFIRDVLTFGATVKKYEDKVLRPPFYKLAGKDDLILPPDPADLRRQELDAEEPVLVGAGGAAGGGTDLPGPDVLPEAAVPRMPGERGAATAVRDRRMRRATLAEIRFYDLLAEQDAGKTFQYRARARFLNPLVGAKPGEVDPKRPEDAWKVEIPGEWSKPSDEITIEPVVRFYFLGMGIGDKANVRLLRWQFGTWHDIRSTTFGVGETIALEKRLLIEVPGDPGKPPVKLPQAKSVDFRTGATVVDVLKTSTKYQGALRQTDKLVYQQGASDVGLHSRLNVVDSNEVGRFLKKVELEQKPKPPKETTGREGPPMPEGREGPPMPGDRPPMPGDRPPMPGGRGGPVPDMWLP